MHLDTMATAARQVALAAVTGTGLLLGGAGFAEAATVSGGTDTFTTNLNSSGGGTPSDTLSFQQFDTNLGTLDSVGISIDYNPAWQVIAGVNGGEFGDVAMADIAASLALRRGGTDLMTGTITQGASCTVDSFPLNCSDTNNSGAIDAGSFANNPLDLIDGASLAAFSGNGTIDLTAIIADLGYTSSYTPGPNSFGFQGSPANSASVAWDGEVTVTYTYTAATTATPEPASLALFGTAIGLAGLIRRRRR